jgi:hypothetical protein
LPEGLVAYPGAARLTALFNLFYRPGFVEA